MMIGMGLFWLAIVVGFFWLAGSGLRQRPQPAQGAPLDLLDRRFAEGAFSIEDDHRRRDVLTGAVGAAGQAEREGSER